MLSCGGGEVCLAAEGGGVFSCGGGEVCLAAGGRCA